MVEKIKLMNKENWLYNAFFCVVFAGIVCTILRLCYCSLPSFDGGLNLQIPYNLLVNGTYSTMYDGGVMFDEHIQTGAPVLIPVYFIYLIFGVGATQSLVINGLYLFVTYIIIYKIGVELKIEKWLLLMLEAAICITPYVSASEYGIGAYGEVPTLFWFLMSIYMFQQGEKSEKKRYFFFGGLCYGLAFLTKIVILIAVPAIVLALLSKWKIEKKITFQHCLLWVGGCIVPILAFEVYKITQLGLIQYIDIQKQVIYAVMQQSGVVSDYSDTVGIIDKFIYHIQTFCSQFRINILILLIILCVNLVYLIYRVIKNRKLEYRDTIILVAFSYFGWWLLITPTEKAWARRILIGVLLMEFVTVFVIDMLYKKYFNKYFKLLIIGIIIMLSIIAGQKIVKISDEEKQDTLEAVEFIKKYKEQNPETVICGGDWWSAPVMQVLTGIPFSDINNVDDGYENLIFVEDKYAHQLADMDTLLEAYEYETIYSNERTPIYIYIITNKNPYKPFTEDEKSGVEESRYVYNEDYEYIRGVNAYEETSGLRWASRNVGLLLKDSEEPRYLYFKYEISNFDLMLESDCEMKIYINENIVYEEEINGNGVYERKIDLNNILQKDELAEIYIWTNAKIDSSSDDRELSYRIYQVELLSE